MRIFCPAIGLSRPYVYCRAWALFVLLGVVLLGSCCAALLRTQHRPPRSGVSHGVRATRTGIRVLVVVAPGAKSGHIGPPGSVRTHATLINHKRRRDSGVKTCDAPRQPARATGTVCQRSPTSPNRSTLG